MRVEIQMNRYGYSRKEAQRNGQLVVSQYEATSSIRSSSSWTQLKALITISNNRDRLSIELRAQCNRNSIMITILD